MALGRRDLIGEQNRRGCLDDRHPSGFNLIGKLGVRKCDPILNINLVNIDVCSLVKKDINGALARI